MILYTSTYNNIDTDYRIEERSGQKLVVIGGNTWGDLSCHMDANNVTWHVNKDKIKRLVKHYEKLFYLHLSINHELWVKNNAPYKFKTSYEEKHGGYKFLEYDNDKVMRILKKIVSKIKNIK